jgi:FKBP-type peptidyl-prolyl cis-trans isomerase FklB
MKAKNLPVLLALWVALPGFAAPELSEADKLSYSLGYSIGSDLKDADITLVPEVVARGLTEGLSGKDGALTAEEVEQVLQNFQQERINKLMEEQEKLAKENLEAGKKFLEENGKKPGVKTLNSGLQYQVINEGKGKSPKASDTVTTHYRGTLIDGTVFDSSYERGQPASFQLDQVIPGWTEAVQMMKEGGKWKLFLPPELGYGEEGAGGEIGPNATLIFEIELLKVN